jgi:hypothetical protein
MAAAIAALFDRAGTGDSPDRVLMRRLSDC